MTKRAIFSMCSLGDCPTVYELDDSGTSSDVLVQGYVVDDAAPEGETFIRVPREFLIQAASKIQLPLGQQVGVNKIG